MLSPRVERVNSLTVLAKIKVDLQKNNKSSQSSVASNRRARNSSKNSDLIPVSSKFQFIINSHPQLFLTGTQLEFLVQNSNYNLDMNSSMVIANDPIAVKNSTTCIELDTICKLQNLFEIRRTSIYNDF